MAGIADLPHQSRVDEFVRGPIAGLAANYGICVGNRRRALAGVDAARIGPKPDRHRQRAARATLVTTGPYRFVRHPMYVGLGALLPSIALVTANALVALSGVIGVALLVKRTSTEEAKLVERFGEAYRQYASRTGRFVPRIS